MTNQDRATIEIVVVIGQTIKELGKIPSGHLYARLMGQLSLETYHKIIDLLVKTGVVKNEGHLLIWVG